MKPKKILASVLLGGALITGGVIYASDHIDAPSVTNQTTDITDLYVFQAQDPNNLVFVANTQGLLTPALTGSKKFDENTIMQFSIDKNGDHIEDLVIQCKYDAASNNMVVYGPVAPSVTGTRSKIEGSATASVAVTAYGAGAPVVATGSTGIKVFAGPRDDPFFFDLNRYHAVLAGTATATQFNNPGSDAFAGTNVMSVVVEVPKTLIGAAGNIDVWLTTRKKA